MPFKERITVPLELIELENDSYHILIRVDICGESGDMIIDTGASVTVVDQNFFSEEEEIEKPESFKSGGINGEIQDIRLIRVDSIKIGGHLVFQEKMATVDMDYINNLYEESQNRRIIGLLGSDFCVKHHAMIDYKNKEFSFELLPEK